MQGTPKRTPRTSGANVGAALLIVIGVTALVANVLGDKIGGDVVPLGIGVAFLVAYALTRHYGFLVAGGILTGVGGGVLAASLAGASDSGVYVVLAGGLGFVLVYAVDASTTGIAARWWPLIPGGAMLLVAGGMATRNEGVMRQIGIWSPLVLVLIGVWILIARSRTERR